MGKNLKTKNSVLEKHRDRFNEKYKGIKRPRFTDNPAPLRTSKRGMPSIEKKLDLQNTFEKIKNIQDTVDSSDQTKVLTQKLQEKDILSPIETKMNNALIKKSRYDFGGKLYDGIFKEIPLSDIDIDDKRIESKQQIDQKEIIDQLQCSVCIGIVKTPAMMCQTCNKAHCLCCVDEITKNKKNQIKCPSCTEWTSHNHKMPALYLSILNTLKFKCDQQLCRINDEFFQYEEYLKHLQKTCPSIEKQCILSCFESYDRLEFINHIKGYKCNYCEEEFTDCAGTDNDNKLKQDLIQHSCSQQFKIKYLIQKQDKKNGIIDQKQIEIDEKNCDLNKKEEQIQDLQNKLDTNKIDRQNLQLQIDLFNQIEGQNKITDFGNLEKNIKNFMEKIPPHNVEEINDWIKTNHTKKEPEISGIINSSDWIQKNRRISDKPQECPETLIKSSPNPLKNSQNLEVQDDNKILHK